MATRYNPTLGFGCVFATEQELMPLADFFEYFFDNHPDMGWFYVRDGKYQSRSVRHRTVLRAQIEKGLSKTNGVGLFDADSSQTPMRSGFECALLGNSLDERNGDLWSSTAIWLSPAEEPEELVTNVLAMARSVALRFGSGGYTFAPSQSAYNVTTESALGLCRLRPGLANWTRHRTPMAKHGIRDTNWLTVVSNELLEKVGGIKAARKKLSEAIVLHEVKEGWLFQAGPEPLLGDANEPGDPFGHYREVALFLKPLRDKTMQWSFDNVPFNSEEFRRWIARFDEPPPLANAPPRPTFKTDPSWPKPAKAALAFRDLPAFAEVEAVFLVAGAYGLAGVGINPLAFLQHQASLDHRAKQEPAFAAELEAARAKASKKVKRIPGPTF